MSDSLTGAWLYGGTNAVRHPVTAAAEAGRLRLTVGDGAPEHLDKAQLHHLSSREDAEIFGRHGNPGWRLGVPSAAFMELAQVLPPRLVYGRWFDRLGLAASVAVSLAASAAVIVAGSLFPTAAAPLVPPSWERSYGDLLLGDLDGRTCDGPGGREALDRLAGSLAPGAAPLELHVVNIPMVNAVALPGRRIVIFRGLLAEASGPDEVAGVLAHEIGHVERRHVTEMMVRQLTFGLLLAVIGGNTGSNFDMFLSARYSRSAEEEADQEAIAALRRAGVSPLPTAGFFARAGGEDEQQLSAVGRGLSYISTHPVTAVRARLFRDSAAGRTDFKPSLSRDDWAALADICNNDPGQNEGYDY
jgi:Zn-dependent protease with chaperone function